MTVGVDYQHIYGKAWNRVIATGEDLDPMADAHENEIAGYVDFRQDLSPWLDVWAKGENLLAQKYEINYGYPMPRAVFMGGVNINI